MLPEEPPSRSDVKAILDAAVPLPEGRYTEAIKAASPPPEHWGDDPWLRDALVLRLDAETCSTECGGFQFKLDELRGLVVKEHG